MSGSGHTDPYGDTWASTQSLPRSVTLDDDGVFDLLDIVCINCSHLFQGQHLRIEPITELESLRLGETHVSHQQITIDAYSTHPMFDVTGNQLEIIATFEITSLNHSNCGINVLVDTLGNLESTQVGFTFASLGAYMVGMDLPGNDYNVTPVAYTVCAHAPF